METDFAAKGAPPYVEQHKAQLSWVWAAMAAIVSASSGHLLIKYGLTSSIHSAAALTVIARIEHYVVQPAVAAGLLIYGLGTLFWMSAVSRRDISFLYPVTALNYVIVSLCGKLFFGESISSGRWLGIAVVMIGTALLHFSAKEQCV
jgi:drug/metabolite transporter (DMT)-like permease